MTDAEIMKALIDGKTLTHPEYGEVSMGPDGNMVNSRGEPGHFPHSDEDGWAIKKRTAYVNLFVSDYSPDGGNEGLWYDTEFDARDAASGETSEYVAIAAPVEIDG